MDDTRNTGRARPQEGSPMNAEPQKEHRWLQKFLGEWTFEGLATMEPGKPPVRVEGTESVRTIGDLWILGEGKGDMPGCGPSSWLTTLGYDPRKGRYVGTFVGSMMAHLLVYDGSPDTAGNVLTLDTEGPDMEGKMRKFKDVVEFKGDDHRVATSRMLGDDGTWHEFMRADYRRRK